MGTHGHGCCVSGVYISIYTSLAGRLLARIRVKKRLCAHHACCVLRQVLGYVTPWNRDGYVVSETFAAKLSYVSPVWYQLREEGGKVVLTGGHDVGATRGRKACHAPVLHDSACVRSC